MLVIVTRYGIAYYDALLTYYVDWNFIANSINTETYVVAMWLFKNLDKMFKRSLVVRSEKGPLRNRKQVKALIKKLETELEVTFSEDNKEEILKAADAVIANNDHFSDDDRKSLEEGIVRAVPIGLDCE